MKLPLLLTFLTITCVVFAQERKILGRIIDQDTKKPVKNAVIFLDENEKAVSNVIGYFELVVTEENEAITISHISYNSTTIDIPADDKFQVSVQMIRPALFPVYLDEYPKKEVKTDVKVYPVNPDEIPAMPVGGNYDIFTGQVGNALYKSADGTKIKVGFTITADGKIADVHSPDSTSELAAAAIKALPELPLWSPAKQKNVAVATNYVIEIASKGPKEINEKILANLKKAFRYPERARRMGADGFVDIMFTVDAQGKVDKTTIIKDVDGECAAEFILRLKELPPDYFKTLMDITGRNAFLFTAVLGLGNSPSRAGRPAFSDAYSLPELMYVVR